MQLLNQAEGVESAIGSQRYKQILDGSVQQMKQSATHTRASSSQIKVTSSKGHADLIDASPVMSSIRFASGINSKPKTAVQS
jgi:hypothetical protein